MNLFELAATLPNGLHDCKVTEIAMSYVERTIRLTVSVWIGDMGGSADLREMYRPGLITLHDFEYCIFDRPDVRYPYSSKHGLTIDLAESDSSVDIEGPGQACRIWVSEWNGFIHLRSGDATLTWSGPPDICSQELR